MLLSDLRNEAEMFSKGKMRCCLKAKNKIIPTGFIGFGSVEIFGFDISSFRNKSQVTVRCRVNGK